MKVIPAIDIMGGRVVRLVQGDPEKKTVYGDDPVNTAKRWEADGADMLHIVDLDATLGRGSNLAVAGRIAAGVSIPVEIAGGLRTEGLAGQAMESAARIVLGTMAFGDTDALVRLRERYGADRIVISVDHVDGRIVVDGWQEKTQVDLFEAICRFLGMGFGRFLLTDVRRDGTLRGPETERMGRACKLGGAEVIASGGISSINDVRRVRDAGASGVILGKALYEGAVSIREAKNLC